MERIEGGISEVEERAFRELAAGVGARRVAVWVGPVPPEQQLARLVQRAHA